LIMVIGVSQRMYSHTNQNLYVTFVYTSSSIPRTYIRSTLDLALENNRQLRRINKRHNTIAITLPSLHHATYAPIIQITIAIVRDVLRTRPNRQRRTRSFNNHNPRRSSSSIKPTLPQRRHRSIITQPRALSLSICTSTSPSKQSLYHHRPPPFNPTFLTPANLPQSFNSRSISAGSISLPASKTKDTYVLPRRTFGMSHIQHASPVLPCTRRWPWARW